MIFKNIKQQVKETLSQKKDAVIESLKEDIIGKPKPKERPTIRMENNYEITNPNNQNMPRNDDYAIAVFISMSNHGGMKVMEKSNDYPGYISYEYKVHDPIKYHKKVIAEGYLEEASPFVVLGKFKVDQLKEILVKNGLESKGKKADLIARIVENVNVKALNLDTLYVPSAKGAEHLKKYEYIFRLRNYGITWEEYDIFRENKPDYLKPNDIIWQMLNKAYQDDITRGYYGPATNMLTYMGAFLEAEERYPNALLEYLCALYFETSGYIGGCLSKTIFDIDTARISPHIAGKICTLSEHYTPDILQKCFKRDVFPNHAIGRRNFERLILDIFEDKPVDILNYIKGRK